MTFDVGSTDLCTTGTLWTKFLWGNYDGYDYLFKVYSKNGVVDQEWTHCSGFGQFFFGEDTYRAQSFKPSTNTISKIALFLGKMGQPADLTVTIMDSLNGSELASVRVPSSQIQNEAWNEIDFGNLSVVKDQTYYIVCRTMTTGPWDKLAWFYGYNDSGQTPYQRGEPWESYYSGSYYIICQTQSGDISNCYLWEPQDENNPYQKGACFTTTNSGTPL
jgi:hypothetical protein